VDAQTGVCQGHDQRPVAQVHQALAVALDRHLGQVQGMLDDALDILGIELGQGAPGAAGAAERLHLGQVELAVLVRHQELVELAQHGDDQPLRGRRVGLFGFIAIGYRATVGIHLAAALGPFQNPGNSLFRQGGYQNSLRGDLVLAQGLQEKIKGVLVDGTGVCPFTSRRASRLGWSSGEGHPSLPNPVLPYAQSSRRKTSENGLTKRTPSRVCPSLKSSLNTAVTWFRRAAAQICAS